MLTDVLRRRKVCFSDKRENVEKVGKITDLSHVATFQKPIRSQTRGRDPLSDRQTSKKGAKLCFEKQNAAFVTFLALVCSNYSTNKGATL